MADQKIFYVSESVRDDLKSSIAENLERYRETGFQDISKSVGWFTQLSINADIEHLEHLDGSNSDSTSDVHNSLVLWQALGDFTPALAAEERVWVQLTHTNEHCLNYFRARWLQGNSGEKERTVIEQRCFARGQRGIFRENYLSRLWWNAWLANHLWPQNQEGALNVMLKKADIRQSFVEIRNTVSSRVLGAAILRAMESHPQVTAKESVYREFKSRLNRQGGGLVFETMSESAVDGFVLECAEGL